MNYDLYIQIVKAIGSKFYESMPFRGANPLISPNQFIQVRVLVGPQNLRLLKIKFIENKVAEEEGYIILR